MTAGMVTDTPHPDLANLDTRTADMPVKAPFRNAAASALLSASRRQAGTCGPGPAPNGVTFDGGHRAFRCCGEGWGGSEMLVPEAEHGSGDVHPLAGSSCQT